MKIGKEFPGEYFFSSISKALLIPSQVSRLRLPPPLDRSQERPLEWAGVSRVFRRENRAPLAEEPPALIPAGGISPSERSRRRVRDLPRRDYLRKRKTSHGIMKIRADETLRQSQRCVRKIKENLRFALCSALTVPGKTS